MIRVDSHLHLTKSNSDNFSDAKKLLLQNLKSNNIAVAFIIANNIIGSTCAGTKTLIQLFKKNKSIYIIGSPSILSNIF
ncbi:hypothetical protein A2477_00265 [Candidatus Falkowbacteria bacterium RIFOXYC2_FULL_47_12]|uniref:Hydrolase TatD n=2 Tax=Candidatus Falkowiibacteriota TaxID=1752728 RepID=A0A1F5TQG9_9BACT|nr:MAG: hypothetical protein A2242_04020 [Candidatus Falkowbacteria bacterium RIFOXYA2_FULL_47_9]OGF41108.1 MAG: hypothetical protein A2477_00265 [Candidatus Falkowbacteria bacterium RIFOXYC2_FULL_47_12]